MTNERRRVMFLGGALLLFLAPPAIPQAGSAAPRGSYLKTCNQIQFNGKTLRATCDSVGSAPRYTSSIVVATCDGDIWNQAGALFCYAKRGTWGQGRAIPRGSYIESCWNERVSGTMLQALCKGRNGAYQDASLELTRCRMGSNISNIDGELVCID
jgi:hypothetical protein